MRWLGLLLNLWRLASRSALIGVCLYLLLLSISWATAGRDPARAVGEIRRAFADGQLSWSDISLNDFRIGSHQFNDCLILNQVITRSGARAQVALTPSYDFKDRNARGCIQLRQRVEGQPGADPIPYHNYVHGHTVVARGLIEYMSIESIRSLYRGLTVLLLLAGWWMVVRGFRTRVAAWRSTFWVSCFASFTLAYGLVYFAPSLGHGPADIVLLGYAVVLASLAGVGKVPIVAAIFGGLTIIFEFLTGGIPLGLALTVAAVVVLEDRDDRVASEALKAAIAFCVAMGAVLFAKLLLTLMLFDAQELARLGDALFLRTQGAVAEEGFTAGEAQPLLKGIFAGFGEMTFGQPWIAGTAIGFVVINAARRVPELRGTFLWPRVLGMLASAAIIAVWIAVFWQHFNVHAWFMTRILVWFLIVGTTISIWSIGIARRGSSPRDPAVLSAVAARQG